MVVFMDAILIFSMGTYGDQNADFSKSYWRNWMKFSGNMRLGLRMWDEKKFQIQNGSIRGRHFVF
jgi:hypothetical protein